MLFSLGPLYNKNAKNIKKIEHYIEKSNKLNKPTQTAMAQLKAISKWNGIPQLKILNEYSNNFKFPVILIHGDQDNVCDIRNTIYLNERLTNSKVYVLKDIGHMIAFAENGCNEVIRILSRLTYHHLNSKL